MNPLNPSIQKSWRWLLANFVGGLSYLIAASFSMPTDTNEGPITTGNDAFSWFFLAFPILGIFAVCNIGWLFQIVFHKDWKSLPSWLCVFVIWCCLLWVEIYLRRQATPY